MRPEAPRMIVSSAARAPLAEMYPPEGRLPSLIADARDNPLVRIPSKRGEVLVKPPTFPYAEHHMLAIPDRTDHEPTVSVIRVPESLLADTFRTAGQIAQHYADNPDVMEINTGWNHSPLENLKHVATQQNTLHVHVTGYTEGDLHHTVSYDEVQRRPELRGKEREPLAGVITSILEREVFGPLEDRPEFDELFRRVPDTNRVTYEMVQGVDTFAHPALAGITQEMHQRTARAYDDLASCFFAQDVEDPTRFAETGDKGNRFVLRNENDRLVRMHEYIAQHRYLTEPQKTQLLSLASQAKTMGEVHAIFEAKKGNELTEDEKYDRNPLMALKGLAYAAVMTGVRNDEGEFTWKFGLDPVVFAPRDVIQASRGTFSHFERNAGAVMSDDARERIQHDEAALIQRLQQSAA